MKLEKITIKNFRRISCAEIYLSPASFIIGTNNCGKSSVIDAINALLSLKTDVVVEADFRQQENGERCDTIELTGVFSEIDEETSLSRGFKGRIIDGKFIYKKTYNLKNVGKPKFESLSYPYTLKDDFKIAKKVQDLIDLGIPADTCNKRLAKSEPNEKLLKGWEAEFIEVVDYDLTAAPKYEENPGGFPSNVISKLPRVIKIPSLVNLSDLEGKEKGASVLSECLSLLFEDLLSSTELAKEIQEKLNSLEEQMNPASEGSLIKKLTTAVNAIISSVFPACGIEITPNLQNLTDIIKPKYDVQLFSNVKTKADKQGTGLVRTVAFAMLRYHSNLKLERQIETRPVIVGFEEPEIYLHPSAANLLRDTIYSLGQTDQIVCTTHSPWMIDLTKDPLSLTKMELLNDTTISCVNYGLTSAFASLPEDDRCRVKMLQMFDDEVSRVFFAERVVVVEGDTELLAIKNTIKLLPEDIEKKILSTTQIVRARGKASIISLVKYLQDLGIKPFVLFDRDKGVKGAEKFNQPIINEVNDPKRARENHECVEDVLGYPVPSSDKPFQAFIYTYNWSAVSDIPQSWKETFESLFDVTLNILAENEALLIAAE
ncbi:ATP-dependent endonuclease [Niastella koreensis]|uniref:ATP-dependent OLD family endonuclease n=2 Tax=Niastella koreensis TaxID=354356 RepID=G8TQ35_NIAKG|nr:ATP-dependent endonuclease [Niastella koreensis]AEW01036.1 ATP-dependent OLD family endonuclease [Niastella koreensis GR20-10]OQP42640.1 ATP-dependent endonuclease [Niastella koreensis]